MTTTQISRLTGATIRQLQWWDESGHISPGLAGQNREYSHEDATAAALMIKLRQRGVSVQKMTNAIRALGKNSTAEWLVLLDSGKPYWASTASEAANVADGLPGHVALVRIKRFSSEDVPSHPKTLVRRPARRPHVPAPRVAPAIRRRMQLPNKPPDPVEQRMVAEALARPFQRDCCHELDWERIDVIRAEMTAASRPGYVRP